jgi:hypothetical protein
MSSAMHQVKFSQTLGTGTVFSEPIKVDISEIVTIQVVTTAQGSATIQVSNDEKNPSNWFDVPSSVQPAVTLSGPGGFWNIGNLGSRFLRLKYTLTLGGESQVIALLKDT